MCKINVYGKIMIEKSEKSENMGIKEILHKSPSKRWNSPACQRQLLPERALTSCTLQAYVTHIASLWVRHS